MAALAAKPSAIHVRVMAEHCVSGRNAIGDGSRGASVALTAVFFSSNAKGFFAIMAGAARKSALHFGHRIGTFLGKIKNCTVTDSAVPVLGKVRVVAKYHGRSVLEVEPDVLGMHWNRQQHDDSRCKEGNNPPVH